MTIEQCIDALLPLVLGVGWLFLLIDARSKLKRKNQEIENSWHAHKRDVE